MDGDIIMDITDITIMDIMAGIMVTTMDIGTVIGMATMMDYGIVQHITIHTMEILIMDIENLWVLIQTQVQIQQ
jgi:hypothetical protein